MSFTKLWINSSSFDEDEFILLMFEFNSFEEEQSETPINNNIMTLILQVFYSVFSGVMLSAAIPNEIYMFGNPLLAFIALIPFHLLVD